MYSTRPYVYAELFYRSHLNFSRIQNPKLVTSLNTCVFFSNRNGYGDAQCIAFPYVSSVFTDAGNTEADSMVLLLSGKGVFACAIFFRNANKTMECDGDLFKIDSVRSKLILDLTSHSEATRDPNRFEANTMCSCLMHMNLNNSLLLLIYVLSYVNAYGRYNNIFSVRSSKARHTTVIGCPPSFCCTDLFKRLLSRINLFNIFIRNFKFIELIRSIIIIIWIVLVIIWDETSFVYFSKCYVIYLVSSVTSFVILNVTTINMIPINDTFYTSVILMPFLFLILIPKLIILRFASGVT